MQAQTSSNFARYAVEAKVRGDRATARRITTEGRIALKCIQLALAAGYAISVNDGETTTVKRSTDSKIILNAMFTTDYDYLYLYKAEKRAGWVMFVYGNGGYDVISDYSVSLEEPFMGKVNDYCATFDV